jgi:hypothetical protein
MDISFLSLFLFIITTLLYISSVPVIGKPKLVLVNNTLTDADFANYYSESMKKMGMFLLIVICTQLALNISYLIDKCQGSAGKNVGSAVIFTLIPWFLIFGVMMMIISAFSGLKNVFSDVIGYFVISGSASDLLNQVLIDTNINALIEKESNNPERKLELTSAAEALMKICGNNSILINQMYPDNFINIWDKLKPLMRDNVYADNSPDNLKQQLLDLVVQRENIGEALWYIYTAILVSSIVYYNLDSRGCVKDINKIKAEYEDYMKEQDAQEKQEEINNSVVYTVS